MSLMASCSFAFVQEHTVNSSKAKPTCTGWPVAPAADSALAITSGIASFLAAKRLAEDDGKSFPNNDFLRMQRDGSLVFGVLLAGAAMYGYYHTAKCRRAKRDFVD